MHKKAPAATPKQMAFIRGLRHQIQTQGGRIDSNQHRFTRKQAAAEITRLQQIAAVLSPITVSYIEPQPVSVSRGRGSTARWE